MLGDDGTLSPAASSRREASPSSLTSPAATLPPPSTKRSAMPAKALRCTVPIRQSETFMRQRSTVGSGGCHVCLHAGQVIVICRTMKSNRRSLLALVGALGLLTGLSARYKTDGSSGVVVPASSDPNGKDLVEGAIVVATEKSGGVRIYKSARFGTSRPHWRELVMVAYNEKGNDFHHAAAPTIRAASPSR